MSNPITKIGQLAIVVSNVEQALSFYRDLLGLTFLFSPSENLAFLSCGETRIMLTTPQGTGEVGKNSIIYFAVTDIAKVYENAINDGATLEREPSLTAKMPDHDLWIGFLKDHDGNLVGLMEEKR